MTDKIIAEVTVLKRKRGVPTVIEVNDKTYILRHENPFQGGGSRGKKIPVHHAK